MAITKETIEDKIEIVGDYKIYTGKDSDSHQRRWRRAFKVFS
jgi:hypothetical protein